MNIKFYQQESRQAMNAKAEELSKYYWQHEQQLDLKAMSCL